MRMSPVGRPGAQLAAISLLLAACTPRPAGDREPPPALAAADSAGGSSTAGAGSTAGADTAGTRAAAGAADRPGGAGGAGGGASGGDAGAAGGTAAKAPPGPHAAEARALFAQRCALCHGMRGHGDGPAAATLRPRPRDYHDAAWQDGISDRALARTIVEGGAAVGKSLMMPPSPDLADRPAVVGELVALIRTFRP